MWNVTLWVALGFIGFAPLALAQSEYAHELSRFVQFETLSMGDWRKENLDPTATSGCGAPKTYVECVTDYLKMYPAKTSVGFAGALDLFVTASGRDKVAPKCDKPCKKRVYLPLARALTDYIGGYRVTKMAVVGWADKHEGKPGTLMRRLSEERAVAESIFKMQAKLEKGLLKINDDEARAAIEAVKKMNLKTVFEGGTLLNPNLTAETLKIDQDAARQADPTTEVLGDLFAGVPELRNRIKN